MVATTQVAVVSLTVGMNVAGNSLARLGLSNDGVVMYVHADSITCLPSRFLLGCGRTVISGR